METMKYFGGNAGKVWEALDGGAGTLTQIQKKTGLTTKEAAMGLGWLAKEGKIRTTNTHTQRARFELLK